MIHFIGGLTDEPAVAVTDRLRSARPPLGWGVQFEPRALGCAGHVAET